MAGQELGASASEVARDTVVRVETGDIRGFIKGGARYFLGIPFAAPPIGQRRWREPAPAEPWAGIRDCMTAPPRCHQVNAVPGVQNQRQGEDCLYLNVTTPATPADRPFPVMVWVHGGAFVIGAGSDYDPTRLVRMGGVMVVTINYRLGPFGFFGFPGLEGSGTFGLQDQQAALAWVRRNAARFGGDPRNVTLFGESAGSMSASMHLVSPTARGLFDKAIMQSGSSLQRWERNIRAPGSAPYRVFTSLAEAEALGRQTQARLKCRDLEDLRRAAPEDLLAAFPSAHPAFGGRLMPEDPALALRAGKAAPVPMIWGGTREEQRAFVSFLQPEAPVTEENLPRLLQEAFGSRAAEVMARYRSAPEGAVGVWAAVGSDSVWSVAFFESFRAASRCATTYAYEFADDDAPNPAFDMPDDFALKAGHATELSYLFDLGGVHAALSAGQERLAEQMISYWTAFAASGDPNGSGRPQWPPFRAAETTPAVLALTVAPDGPELIDFAERHNCDFWTDVLADAPRP